MRYRPDKPELTEAEKAAADYKAVLASRTCACGRDKAGNVALCSRCFFKLPDGIRFALYHRQEAAGLLINISGYAAALAVLENIKKGGACRKKEQDTR